MAEVLVVDDAEAMLQSLAIVLSKAGYCVHLALDLGTAKDVLRQRPIDLVLLGLAQPSDELKGFLAELAAREPPLTTVLTQPHLAQLGAEIRSVEMLKPPLSVQKVLDAVRRLTD